MSATHLQTRASTACCGPARRIRRVRSVALPIPTQAPLKEHGNVMLVEKTLPLRPLTTLQQLQVLNLKPHRRNITRIESHQVSKCQALVGGRLAPCQPQRLRLARSCW